MPVSSDAPAMPTCRSLVPQAKDLFQAPDHLPRISSQGVVSWNYGTQEPFEGFDVMSELLEFFCYVSSMVSLIHPPPYDD